MWGYTYFGWDIVKTNEGITITAATAQSENEAWDVYAHEFSHLSLGLPDLYSCAIAFKGPPDWRQAAVYAGPWDLMSRSSIRPQIGAWGKIHVGWIPQENVRELYSNQQAAVTVNPLENSTSGTQAVAIYLTPTTYFVIENREQIGFDGVLPDKGILISYIDEGKYWRCNGPVVIQDANPNSGPRWQLLQPTFDIGPQAKSQYTNQTFNLAVELLDRFPNGSYVIAVGKPDAMDMAKVAYMGLNQSNSAIVNASITGRTQGLDNARIILGQAWLDFSNGDFQMARESGRAEPGSCELCYHPITDTTECDWNCRPTAVHVTWSSNSGRCHRDDRYAYPPPTTKITDVTPNLRDRLTIST